MHEYSLAMALIDKIESLKKERGFKSVRTIVLEIGNFSNVVPEAFSNAFEMAKTGTCAASAELVIEDKRGELVCDSCGAHYFPDIPIALCPQCGKLSGQIVQGRELLLKSLEVDDEDPGDQRSSGGQ